MTKKRETSPPDGPAPGPGEATMPAEAAPPARASSTRRAKAGAGKASAKTTGKGTVKTARKVAGKATGKTADKASAKAGPAKKPRRAAAKRPPSRKTFLVAATIPDGDGRDHVRVYAAVTRTPEDALAAVRAALGADMPVEFTGKLSGRMAKALGLTADEVRRI